MNSSNRTIFHRIVAVGFILMTISGNFWLIYLMLSSEVNIYVVNSFQFGMILVIFGGLGMIINFFRQRFGTVESPTSDSENKDID